MIISFEGTNQREDKFGSYDTGGAYRVPPRDPRVDWDLQVYECRVVVYGEDITYR